MYVTLRTDEGLETLSPFDSSLSCWKRMYALLLLLAFGPFFIAIGSCAVFCGLLKVGLCWLGFVKGEYRDGTWYF